MKKEEYLKKFREYDQKGIAREKYKDKLRKESKKLNQKLQKLREKLENADNDPIKKKVLLLLKKAFNDPDLYIKTNRTSFVLEDRIMINANSGNIDNTYYGAFLPVTNSRNDSISIYEYLEKNAVDCENEENRDLLKEINGEVNHKGDYFLIVVEQNHPAIKLYYGEFSKFEIQVNSIIKKESFAYCNGLSYFWEKGQHCYIKYFNSRQDLNNFLSENVIEKKIFDWRYLGKDSVLNFDASDFTFKMDRYNQQYTDLISQMEELK